MRCVRTLVHSPNAAILAGLAATLDVRSSRTPRTEVVIRVSVATEVELRVNELKPDVVVLHRIGDSQAYFRDWSERDVRVVLAVTGDEFDGSNLLVALRTGVFGAIAVDNDLEALPQACQWVANGLPYVSPSLIRMLISHLSGEDMGAFASHSLTVREVQVLRRLAAGESRSQIAEDMKIAQRTVKHHLANIYRKLKVRNQIEAVILAYREGLVA